MKIDFFTHIIPSKYKKLLGEKAPELEKRIDRQMSTLYSLDDRFRVMDKFPDVKHVLTISMTGALILDDPNLGPDLARQVNDEMAELVDRYPDRFVASVASLPMGNMDVTLKELDRALGTLKLKGIQMFTPWRGGRPWDLQDLMPLFQKMAEYDLPIWIHPVRPVERDDYERYFMDHVFGWPYESTGVMIRLVFKGIMEKFPTLRFLIHHCGALVPFFSDRIETSYTSSRWVHGVENEIVLPKPVLEYFRQFYTDTALSGGTAGLMCGYAFFGAEHLLFATDMPYDSEFGARLTRQTIEAIEGMTISNAEKRQIYEGNARKLLGL